MKIVCLFGFLYLWDPLNQDASDCVLGLFQKLSKRRVHGLWFHGIWTWCGAKVLECWIISSLKIKLNQIVAENFGGIGMCLWWYWKDLDEPGFNGIYLVRFGFRMWEILILKWFLPLKIQINSKKSGFGRKNQLMM
jgi:hypothetical protein